MLADTTFPPTVSVAVTSDQSKFVKDMVHDLQNNIMTALVLVLAVILIALGGRSALFVSLAIPFSMLITFTVIQMLDITLNMIVLWSFVFTDQPLLLAFNPFELLAMFAGVLIAAFALNDGESNWFEGAMMVLVYIAFACVFWFHP